MSSKLIKKNIDINIFVYKDSVCHVFMENPITGPRNTDDVTVSMATTEDVIDQWISWLDVLDTAKKIPALQEQLEHILFTYKLAKDY